MKLISLNVQCHRHLDVIIPFLQEQAPDVLCLQEVFEEDVPTIQSELGMTFAHFTPLCLFSDNGDEPKPWGIALFSWLPVTNLNESYYEGSRDNIQNLGDSGTRHGAVLYGTFEEDDGKYFTVGTIHFTWTEDGKPNDLQRKHLEDLFEILDKIPELILAGDFNAPRGMETFEKIASRYKDNIPAEYIRSLDENIHRAGHLPYMVDGLFTSPQYIAEGTYLVDGVSDHMAVVSNIRRAED